MIIIVILPVTETVMVLFTDAPLFTLQVYIWLLILVLTGAKVRFSLLASVRLAITSPLLFNHSITSTSMILLHDRLPLSPMDKFPETISIAACIQEQLLCPITKYSSITIYLPSNLKLNESLPAEFITKHSYVAL